MSRRKQAQSMTLKFKAQTIILSVEAARALEDKFDKIARKAYDNCSNVAGYDGLVKKEYYYEKQFTASAPEKVSKFSESVIKAIPAYARKCKAEDVKYEREAAADRKKRAAEHLKKMKAIVKANPLPDFLKVDDLVAPESKDDLDYNKQREFFSASDMAWSQSPLYFVEGFGWCLPVLKIKSAGRSSNSADRAYAVRLSDGAQVRVGLGPHVTVQAVLHLKKSNYARLTKSLKPLLDAGAVKANQTRDQLSTRRMRRRQSWF